LEVVRGLGSLDDLVEHVPILEGVTEVPPLRPDGTVVTDPGYDAATRLFYAPPDGFVLPPVAIAPTATEVEEARKLLEELMVDFPFVDQASRANALAALITPLVRPLITGCMPLGVFDKPKQGTGASLLIMAIAQLVTGREAATLPAPDKPEEWGKLITTVLLAGRSFILIDNVIAPLRSAHLARALTTPVWEDRLLGETRLVRLPQRAAWYATGNNIRLADDVPRRAYWSRQDAGLEHPEDRPASRFRHPEFLAWVGAERPRLIAAVLTLARHWIAQRCPRATVPPFGSFESWATVVGSILELAGVPEFLGNRKRMREDLDDEAIAWCVFFAAWFEHFDTRDVTVSALAAACRPKTDGSGDPVANPLQEALPSALGDSTDRQFSVRRAAALRTRRDQVFGELQLRRGSPDKHRKVVSWRLEQLASAEVAED